MMDMPQNLSGMQPPAAKPQTAMQAPAAPEEAPNVTPQEQALYERTVAGALLAAFVPKALKGTLATLEGGDPAEGIALVTGAAMARVAEAAMRKGQRIPTDVLMHAATEVFETVAEFAAQAGMAPQMASDPAMQQAALVRAFEEMRGALPPGSIDEQEMQADFAEVQAADKRGAASAPQPGAQPPMAKGVA